MCGIAGLHGDFEPPVLERMTNALAHRGPDGEGVAWFSGAPPTGFGHRRLAIIDLSDRASQPMTVRCASCHADAIEQLALVFNGEIYNYRELRRELEAAGHRFHSESDSEVLLHLYAEHGPSLVEHLNGIFAFAIRDAREVGRPGEVPPGGVLLVRDHLGIKPLYLTVGDRGVAFASELKALLEVPDLDRTLDLRALHSYLALLWTPAPRTMLRGVEKVEPGAAMVLAEGRVVRRWSYYRGPFVGRRASGSAGQLHPELRRHVGQAVARQMVADVPVGAFLSGGLDSSTVVAMAIEARDGDANIPCYAIGFENDRTLDGSPSDLPFARRVAAHLGVPLTEIVVGPQMVEDLPRLVWLLDEPAADPAPINALMIAERARRDGVPVLLSGAGGDDILSGYRRHVALRAERLWGWLPAPARSALRRLVSGSTAGRMRDESGFARRLRRAFAHADWSGDRRLASYFLWSDDSTRRGLYGPALAEATASADSLGPLLETLKSFDQETDPLKRMLGLEVRHFLADHNLNYTDKTGMAAGVEVRVPLLDLDLVSFASTIPSPMLVRRGTAKWLFKESMVSTLPPDVVYRPKTGFGAPLRAWMGRELAPLANELMNETTLRQRGLFEPAAVARLRAANTAGQQDASYALFAIMCLELWCRRFVDGRA